jgi:carbonic anhydrase/acetyltransferase-like protein (isoleucine patch superfamily)
MTIYSFEGVSPTLPKGDDYWVAPNAQVMGRVVLGTATSIWFGAVLRGDNEPITVGEGSNIQENATLHTDMGYPATIGRNCTIGHAAIVHGATIGDNSLVGMGATILNGAKIGKNCLVGAGALVTEGKEFPDGSLIVGVPAVAKRQLSTEAIEGLTASATGYQEKMRLFRDSLEEVG